MSEPPAARSGPLGVVDRGQAAVRGRWRHERGRRPWLDHLARAYERYKGTNGDHLAAAITYFSFLALFPMVLLAVSIAAYVLASHEDVLAKLQKLVIENLPAGVDQLVNDLIDQSLQHKGTIGLVGLLGVAYAGLGWIGNLRAGVQIVWACAKVEQNPIKAKLEDLLVLVGLGLGILLSLTLTAGGTAVADTLIKLAGLKGTPGLGTALTMVTLLLAVATDTLVFAWLFTRLPRRPVRLRSVLRGALFAAVGYEALKLGATLYLPRVGSSGIYGLYLSIAVLLIWIDLVSRFLLFSVAWTATAPQPEAPDTCPAPSEQDAAVAEPSPDGQQARPPHRKPPT